MDNSSLPSVSCSPFKDVTNTSTSTGETTTSTDNLRKKPPSRQGWYARMSDEKKAEYLERQRVARQQKKAAIVFENSAKHRSSGQGWYARLTDEKKAEYLEKQRISRQIKKIDALSMNIQKSEPSSQRVSPGKLG